MCREHQIDRYQSERYQKSPPKQYIYSVNTFIKLWFADCIGAQADVAILMDESGSVNSADFKKEKDFAWVCLLQGITN